MGPPWTFQTVPRLKAPTLITPADERGLSHVLGIRTWTCRGPTQTPTFSSAQALVHTQIFIDLLHMVHGPGQREFYCMYVTRITHTHSHGHTRTRTHAR